MSQAPRSDGLRGPAPGGDASGAPAVRRALVRLLQMAHAGELAAALAYGGHWRATRDAGERARIREIEAEELHHRALVAELLARMGVAPAPARERRAALIGRALAALCRVSGWFAPMYGAGRLERRNIVEYENAARLARDCGESAMIDCLLGMAEVEWEHERFFRERIAGRFLSRIFPAWPPPPPKASIRAPFRSGDAREVSRDETAARGASPS